jgi:hypothetical protein
MGVQMKPVLYGPKGNPISSADFQNKKANPPALGQKYGQWAGPDVNIMRLPGGGALQFDLEQLTLSDFRQMKDHYQINSSLVLLTFLMHEMDWRIECSDKKQRDFYTEVMTNIWTPLVRAKSQAFWAGFSPNVLDWENNVEGRRIEITKVKDLLPEDCAVHWDQIDGANNKKLNVYDGIDTIWSTKPIPVESSYWYPLLMENGNYYGKKLLRAAFQPWFFSILLHLFANRYYERFGEPTPIGRAPYDEDIRFGGDEMPGNEAMAIIMTMLRNRTAVVLPNQKTPMGDETTIDYDYQLEYLESQMRGADFERYLTRLDEEMSIGLFTPILMMRTADVGSYNLGTQHTTTYKWLLNAIGGDWKFYIDWYMLRPLRDYNFGTNAELPKIIFRRQGAHNEELIRDVVRAMIGKQQIEPKNLDQLSEIAGIELQKAKELVADDTEPAPGDPTQPSQADSAVLTVVNALCDRIEPQVRSGFKKGFGRDHKFNLGFQAKFESALREIGHPYTLNETKKFYSMVERLLEDMKESDQYRDADAFMKAFRETVHWYAGTLESAAA